MFPQIFTECHMFPQVFYRVPHVSAVVTKSSLLSYIVKFAKILKLSEIETRIKIQSVFQLETLCNHALDSVV